MTYTKQLREIKNREWAEEKAKRQAWYDEERKKKEEEEAKRDPWEDEKLICDQLISWVGRYLPKKAEEKAEAQAIEVPAGVKILKKEEEDDPYASLVKKKGKKGKGGGDAAKPKSVKISLGPEDFAIFEKLGFKAPAETGECAALYEQLLEKKEWLKTAPPKPKKVKEEKKEEKEEKKAPAEEAPAEADGDDVEYKVVLGAFVDAAISEMSATKPDDPYRKMYEFLFQASLVDYTTSPATVDRSTWDSDFVAKFGLQFHGDAVVASKGKGKGPKSGVKFMLADAGDFFSELSKKMKATGAPLTGMMTAEELKAADAAAAKMKREKEAKEQAARDLADAENAKKQAEMEASGKKVSGGLHKFDASEVDINGGAGTADDFMDAFGF